MRRRRNPGGALSCGHTHGLRAIDRGRELGLAFALRRPSLAPNRPRGSEDVWHRRGRVVPTAPTCQTKVFIYINIYIYTQTLPCCYRGSQAAWFPLRLSFHDSHQVLVEGSASSQVILTDLLLLCIEPPPLQRAPRIRRFHLEALRSVKAQTDVCVFFTIHLRRTC